MKTVFALFALLLLVVVGGKYVLDYMDNGQVSLPFIKTPTVSIHTSTFNLYVPQTHQEKEIGLSDRQSMPENYAMLFQFEKADYYPFWMKNMKFPIDIVFLKDNVVNTIYSQVQPPQANTGDLPLYAPGEPINAVLEFNAGTAEKLKIKKGDTVKISL